MNVLGTQEVLRLALAILAVGIDEEHVLSLGGVLFVDDQNAGRNASAVEQPGRQTDDGLQPAALDEVLARLLFLATAEEHTMGHDGGHFPFRLQHGDHVLHKHEVGLLALLGQPDGEASGKIDVFLDVVLRERGIGGDAVETSQLAALGLVLRVADGVLLPDVCRGNPVKQHVHFADGPCRAHALLAGEREVARITAALAHIVARLDQHAAGTAGRVIHAHAGLRREDLRDDAHDIRWRVELSRFLPRGIREELDQVFVGRTEQVGKLEVLIAQRDLLEVLHEVGKRVVVERALADLAVEVDALEHILKCVHVRIFKRFEGFVQRGADVRF